MRRGDLRALSGEKFLNNFATDVGQSQVAALRSKRELRMIDSHQMKEGSLDVVDVDLVLDGIKTKFVGRTHALTRVNAAAGKPHGEGIDVVVAPDGLAPCISSVSFVSLLKSINSGPLV